MATIEVQQIESGDPYEFRVSVIEGTSQTHHRVTLAKADYERLAAGKATPEQLVSESFRFLLEHERKESILRSFDLTVIARYFPGYEREIGKRL